MESSRPSIEDLIFKVSGLSYELSQYLNNNENDGWTTAEESIKVARSRLLNILATLRDTVLGPSDRIREMATEWASPSALRWILHFKIADHVPLLFSISYPDLAKQARVPESQLKRIMRFTMTDSLFRETEPGHVSHTPMSERLRSDNPLHDYLAHCLEFSMPVTTKMTEATVRFGETDAKDHTAFNVAFDTPLPMFAWLKAHPDHAGRFGRLMHAMHASPAWDTRHLVDGYPWAELGDAKVVDVGGGLGHCSISLAKAFARLSCVVQDLEFVVKDAAVPGDLKGRVRVQVHDFFQPQTVTDADVYMLRQVLHDWPDESAIQILKNIVPALKKGARVLVMDQVVPAPGQLPQLEEKTARTVDLVVMSHFNGKQRGIEDWEKVFAGADSRLKIKDVRQPKGSVFAIIELVLDSVAVNGHADISTEAKTDASGNAKDDIEVKTNGLHE